MIFLTKNAIVLINQRTIKAHGGNYMPPSNFLHESSLDYIIDIINSEMFGAPLYPELADKAAVYMFNIISNHIFSDGNKRTGLEASLAFLKLNGYRINSNLPELNLLDFVIKVASGQSSLEECQDWFKDNITPL